MLSPQEDIVSERLETLYRMTSGTKGLDVVIASAVTAAQRMAPVAYVGANTFFFRPGDTLSVEGLRLEPRRRRLRRRQAGARGG